jgi:hypothetical protein
VRALSASFLCCQGAILLPGQLEGTALPHKNVLRDFNASLPYDGNGSPVPFPQFYTLDFRDFFKVTTDMGFEVPPSTPGRVDPGKPVPGDQTKERSENRRDHSQKDRNELWHYYVLLFLLSVVVGAILAKGSKR